MSDETEALRRIELSTASPALALAIERGDQVWETEDLRRDFEVTGFMAPFVVVKRRSDGKVGTLKFHHHPRVYFGWVED
jgi:hypothetical protein